MSEDKFHHHWGIPKKPSRKSFIEVLKLNEQLNQMVIELDREVRDLRELLNLKTVPLRVLKNRSIACQSAFDAAELELSYDYVDNHNQLVGKVGYLFSAPWDWKPDDQEEALVTATAYCLMAAMIETGDY